MRKGNERGEGLIGRLKSNIVLYGALAANIGIAIAKFIAAAISGSSSMLTEGVHSLVDSGNQLLLLYGQHRAKKPPDGSHPFGYGRELYFWAFVVAILIFAVGSGVSILEGFMHIADPEPLHDPLINYVVLAVATILEGSSWTMFARVAAGGSSRWPRPPRGTRRRRWTWPPGAPAPRSCSPTRSCPRPWTRRCRSFPRPRRRPFAC